MLCNSDDEERHRWRRGCRSLSHLKGLKRTFPSWKEIRQSPRRAVAAQLVCTAIGFLTAVGVGLVLFHNSLQTQRQEFKLKCSNRQEVRFPGHTVVQSCRIMIALALWMERRLREFFLGGNRDLHASICVCFDLRGN